MSRSLLEIFGSGAADPYASLLTEDQTSALKNRSMMMAGLKMLQQSRGRAGEPEPGFFDAAVPAIATGMDTYSAGQNQLLQQQAVETLPPGLRSLARAAPNEVFGEAAKAATAAPEKPSVKIWDKKGTQFLVPSTTANQMVNMGFTLTEPLGATLPELNTIQENYQDRIKNYRGFLKAKRELLALTEKEGPVRDVAAIYNLVKLFDPNSVVKEGEISLMQSAMPKWEQFKEKLEGIEEGGFLGEETKADLYGVLDQLNEIYRKSYEKTKADHIRKGKDVYEDRGITFNVWRALMESDLNFGEPLVIDKKSETPQPRTTDTGPG